LSISDESEKRQSKSLSDESEKGKAKKSKKEDTDEE
jgi:hypothetical protein